MHGPVICFVPVCDLRAVGDDLRRRSSVTNNRERLVGDGDSAMLPKCPARAGRRSATLTRQGVSEWSTSARSRSPIGPQRRKPSSACRRRRGGWQRAGMPGKAIRSRSRRIAGIQAAKRTADLIPLCHPLLLSHIAVLFRRSAAATARRACQRFRADRRRNGSVDRGSVAALTIYDMLKAADRGMVIERVRLLTKSGGRSGTYRASPRTAPGAL